MGRAYVTTRLRGMVLTPRQRLSHKLRDGKYRARLLGCRADTIPVSAALFFLDIHQCYYCHQLFDQGPEGDIWTLEHKEPLVLGGAHELSNLAKSCQSCNETKHIQAELDYLARLDRAS